MRAAFYITVILFCISCGKQSAVSKKLSGCDSLVITFTDPQSDQVLNMVNTTEEKAIRKLAGFLNGKERATDSCSFNGHMIFYKNGQQVMPVVFNYSEKDCRYFLFDIENKTTGTSMNNEAANVLQSLKEGRSWY